jgi:hypothetical protein
MSKKSRKRNKKILGALAAGLGAMALMKGRKGNVSKTAASENANVGINTRSSLIDAQDAGTAFPKKSIAILPKSKPINANKFRTRHRITDSGGNTISPSPGLNAQIMQAKANAPKGIYPPGMKPMQRIGTHPLHRGLKSGGRVTGAAKRGFGRALMKGKK